MQAAGNPSFLDRYLTVWIFAAMALGIGLGALVPGLPQALAAMNLGSTNLPTAGSSRCCWCRTG